MCLQCTLLGPLIQVDKSGAASQHAFAFMAQLDHRLEKLYFDMSKEVRRQATETEVLACVEPCTADTPPRLLLTAPACAVQRAIRGRGLNGGSPGDSVPQGHTRTSSQPSAGACHDCLTLVPATGAAREQRS